MGPHLLGLTLSLHKQEFPFQKMTEILSTRGCKDQHLHTVKSSHLSLSKCYQELPAPSWLCQSFVPSLSGLLSLPLSEEPMEPSTLPKLYYASHTRQNGGHPATTPLTLHPLATPRFSQDGTLRPRDKKCFSHGLPVHNQVRNHPSHLSQD